MAPYLGTGGAISIKTEAGILVTPSGILKESVTADDVFTLDMEGAILQPPGRHSLKFSSCFPNFRHIYSLRYGLAYPNVGAFSVIVSGTFG